MDVLFLLWMVCAIIVAVIASHKGRSAGGWFCLGLLIGPFALAVGFLPSREAMAQAEARRTGQAGGFRKCPSCAEAIRVEAVKCRYCQSALPKAGVPPASITTRRRLRDLDAAGLLEAQGYLATLADAGYPGLHKGRDGWEILTLLGRVAHRVGTLEELREAALHP